MYVAFDALSTPDNYDIFISFLVLTRMNIINRAQAAPAAGSIGFFLTVKGIQGHTANANRAENPTHHLITL